MMVHINPDTILLAILPLSVLGQACLNGGRCRPDEPCWPPESAWNALNASVNGRLLVPENIVQSCLDDEDSAECEQSLKNLGKDPFFMQTNPGASESSGQINAWKFYPSTYAVEAHNEADIVNAVNFARHFNLRLVVKGTGHDYYGRSSSPDSLLIWTHSMRDLRFHDGFFPAGSNQSYRAVTLEAGLTWMDVYAAAAVDRNLYVQGGGCTSVGVVGWHIGGGFGSFSKMFGTGPANMLEAKVVTAQGEVVVASEYQNEDLFYALRGGGYGFGVVVSITVRTHPLPAVIGGTTINFTSKSREGAVLLLSKFLDLYRDQMLGTNWGEQLGLTKGDDGYRMTVGMLSLLTFGEMVKTWEPLIVWAQQQPEEYSVENPNIFDIPARGFWDKDYLAEDIGKIPSPYDPKEPTRAFTWGANLGEISSYWLAYVSRYLEYNQFLDDTQAGAEKLIELTEGVGYAGLHLNKAQYGAPEWAVKELDKTPMHPSIKNSFGLMISASAVGHFSPLVSNEAQRNTSNIMDILSFCQTNSVDDCDLSSYYDAVNKFREATPGAGAYFNEADYNEPDWQNTFWGNENYKRLLDIKRAWDPEELFYCHNCVGSEYWEKGGFCRKA